MGGGRWEVGSGRWRAVRTMFVGSRPMYALRSPRSLGSSRQMGWRLVLYVGLAQIATWGHTCNPSADGASCINEGRIAPNSGASSAYGLLSQSRVSPACSAQRSSSAPTAIALPVSDWARSRSQKWGHRN